MTQQYTARKHHLLQRQTCQKNVKQVVILGSIDQRLKSVSSLVSLESMPKICFSQALRYSAETMGFLKPDNLDLGKGLARPRIWSWVQTLIGLFLFVMFSLALKNKLKR